MIKLSSLIQASVDFSKHGKAVDPKDWAEYEESLEGMYPDYLEKGRDTSYESPLILGKLFRAVDTSGKVEQMRKKDFEYSVLC